jgi:hypothetical protein
MVGRNRRGITMVKANTVRELAEKITQGLEAAKEERHET